MQRWLLIVATQGLQRGIINDATFTSVVLLVVVSTIVTPPLLKLLFSRESRRSVERKLQLVSNHSGKGGFCMYVVSLY
ncbi:MAG: hypothetical protein ACLR23_17835 [Clostridia bacterium]